GRVRGKDGEGENAPFSSSLLVGEGRVRGKLTPKEISNLRILDPACGSGSFLIGAYQYLLDYHLNWYRENEPEKHAKGKKPSIYKGSPLSQKGVGGDYGPGGEWRLTTTEKKRILLNNIYGVDIDRQAVEVTKLSLLLKVLEGENEQTLGKTFALFQERALPNLESNIKCGNSLVGPDFYDSLPLFVSSSSPQRGEGRVRGKGGEWDASSSPSPLAGEGWGEGEMDRINVFDWNDNEKGFGRIMKDGGFDCVIGNPPYVRQEMLGEFKPYFESRYTAYHGMADLYVYFIEKAVSLLKEGGLFSYIVANKWMRANYGEPLRRWMKKQAIEEITDFGDLPVFQTATTYPCILRIRKGKPANTLFTAKMSTLDFQDMQEYVNEHKYKVSRLTLDDKGWSLAGAEEEALLAKIKSRGVPLGEYVEGKIYYGIKTGLNEAFVIDEATRKRLVKEDPKSKELIRSFLIGRDIKRYSIAEEGRYLIFIPKGWTREKSGGSRDAWQWFGKNYPAIAGHLLPYKAKAEKRCDKGDYWWELRACDYYGEFEKPKIIFPDISTKGNFALDTNNSISVNTSYIMPVSDLYLLGILNSKITTFYYSNITSAIRGGYLRFIFQYVSKLPIRAINFKDKKDKSLHDKMVSLVDNMLELNKKLPSVKTPHERELLERQIKITDNQIDRLVYELYALTEEEIKVVEGE
ncbi:MAG: TaqI-like C-terminal specificity domain-containing protein, partial [Thermodesulfobacteriota bacterium]